MVSPMTGDAATPTLAGVKALGETLSERLSQWDKKIKSADRRLAEIESFQLGLTPDLSSGDNEQLSLAQREVEALRGSVSKDLVPRVDQLQVKAERDQLQRLADGDRHDRWCSEQRELVGRERQARQQAETAALSRLSKVEERAQGENKRLQDELRAFFDQEASAREAQAVALRAALEQLRISQQARTAEMEGKLNKERMDGDMLLQARVDSLEVQLEQLRQGFQKDQRRFETRVDGQVKTVKAEQKTRLDAMSVSLIKTEERMRAQLLEMERAAQDAKAWTERLGAEVRRCGLAMGQEQSSQGMLKDLVVRQGQEFRGELERVGQSQQVCQSAVSELVSRTRDLSKTFELESVTRQTEQGRLWDAMDSHTHMAQRTVMARPFVAPVAPAPAPSPTMSIVDIMSPLKASTSFMSRASSPAPRRWDQE